MQYTVIIDGRSYDLPKKTIKVAEKLDEVAKIDSQNIPLRQKFQALFDFVKSLVGAEDAKEILGGEKLDEVDLSDVTLAFRKIFEAYEKPIEDYVTEKNMRKLESVPIDKIVALGNTAQKMGMNK